MLSTEHRNDPIRIAIVITWVHIPVFWALFEKIMEFYAQFHMICSVFNLKQSVYTRFLIVYFDMNYVTKIL